MSDQILNQAPVSKHLKSGKQVESSGVGFPNCLGASSAPAKQYRNNGINCLQKMQLIPI